MPFTACPDGGGKPLVKVHCGAIPESLIDSELFGHEKGAFTSAIKQKKGRFERADKGTIFLDEIGELPAWGQIRLLRVLQTREIERLGGSPPVTLDIRVIVATHRNLAEMVAQGRFREDLWFRINAFPIVIPPLRQRRQDIPLLARHFLKRKAREMGIQQIPDIDDEQMACLSGYHWPGNVRELENVVERTLIQHRQGPLHFFPRTEAPPRSVPVRAAGQQPALLDAVVREHIERVLTMTGGKISGKDGTAGMLGIHPNTLRHRMKKLGILFGRAGKKEKETA